MTPEEFNVLSDGASVWFRPPYFAFAMPATVRTRNGRSGLWINFYGDGQCRFEPQDGREKRFADWVASDGTYAKTLAKTTKQLRNEAVP